MAADIRIPALIISAEDDPFVPAAQFGDAAVRDNPLVTVCVARHGGHCGFVGQPSDNDGYWAEASAVDFLARHLD